MIVACNDYAFYKSMIRFQQNKYFYLRVCSEISQQINFFLIYEIHVYFCMGINKRLLIINCEYRSIKQLQHSYFKWGGHDLDKKIFLRFYSLQCFNKASVSQSKFECQSSSLKRDKELTILCYINKGQVMFLVTF